MIILIAAAPPPAINSFFRLFIIEKDNYGKPIEFTKCNLERVYEKSWSSE